MLGHTLRVRVDVDKCKGKTKKKKTKKKPTCSPGKLAADTQMGCVCMRTQMSIKKGQQKNKKTYLEIMGWDGDALRADANGGNCGWWWTQSMKKKKKKKVLTLQTVSVTVRMWWRADALVSRWRMGWRADVVACGCVGEQTRMTVKKRKE